MSLPFEDDDPHEDGTPVCQTCGASLRLDIVLFDEQIAVEAAWPVQQALRDCDLFLAVGTSGTVAPACNFVRSASYAGCERSPSTLSRWNHEIPTSRKSIPGRPRRCCPHSYRVTIARIHGVRLRHAGAWPRPFRYAGRRLGGAAVRRHP